MANPTRHWLGAIWRSGRNYHRDVASTRAAAIAYYALVSIFPFITLLAAGASQVVGERRDEVVAELRHLLQGIDPSLWQDLQAFGARSGVVSIFSGIVLFAVASRVSIATERAFRDIFRGGPGDSSRLVHRIYRRLRAYLMTLVGLVAIVVLFVVRGLLDALRRLEIPGLEQLSPVLEHPVVSARLIPAVLVGLLAYFLYRTMAGVSVAPRHALVGAGVFVAGHELAMTLAQLLARELSGRDVIYGSFVGLVSLVVWVYWLSSVLLMAAELVAELNGNRARDDEEEPLGEGRGGELDSPQAAANT